MPLLFVSDSILATQTAVEYGKSKGMEISYRESAVENPLHLEKSNSTDAANFFETFIDAYMIGMGRCTSYFMGGFGKWGSRMGYDSSCFYHMKAQMEPCRFSYDPQTKSQMVYTGFQKPLFLPPMSSFQPDVPSDVTIQDSQALENRVLKYYKCVPSCRQLSRVQLS